MSCIYIYREYALGVHHSWRDFTYLHTHTYKYTHVFIYMYVYFYTHLYTDMHTYTYILVHIVLTFTARCPHLAYTHKQCRYAV